MFTDDEEEEEGLERAMVSLPELAVAGPTAAKDSDERRESLRLLLTCSVRVVVLTLEGVYGMNSS